MATRARREELALYRHALQGIDRLSSVLIDDLTFPIYQLQNRGFEVLDRKLVKELTPQQQLAIENYMDRYDRELDAQQQASIHLAQQHKQDFVKTAFGLGIPLALLQKSFQNSYRFIRTGLKTKDGLTLTQRLYKRETQFTRQASNLLSDAVVEGSKLTQLAKNLKDFVVQKGTASVQYVMNRLSVSELKASYAHTGIITMKDLEKSGTYPGTFYKVYNLSPAHEVEDECDEHFADGNVSQYGENVYTVDSFPTLPIHPHCVLPDTIVISPDAEHFTKAWYEGDVLELRLANGRRVSVTPNHIFLTTRGFVAAKLLRQGDQIFKTPLLDGIINRDPNTDHRPATIAQVVEALTMTSSSTTTRVPVAAEDLHGDGHFIKSDIDIITPDSLLRSTAYAALSQAIQDAFFNPTIYSSTLFNGSCDLATMLLSLAATADGIMSSLSPSPILFGRPLSDSEMIRLSSSSNYNARTLQAQENSGTVDIEAMRQLQLRYPTLIQTDELIDIKIYSHKGYVYDVGSTSTVYTANGYITSNCRCYETDLYIP
jgi:hypothetical protein